MEIKYHSGVNKIIDVKNVAICYDDLGKGPIPIIFIHGFPFNKSMWQPQIDLLSKTHRIIAYDIRGYGKSATGNQKFSINQFADDLIEFMNSMQIKKAVFCGLSMGGYILLNFANRFPDRLYAIILSDTQCIADTAEIKEKRRQTISLISSGGLKDFTESFLNNIFSKSTIEHNKEVVDNIRNIILTTPINTITATLSALAEREAICGILAKINTPTLIICGKEDTVTPPAQSEYLHEHIKNSTLQYIDQAGHLSNLEQPDEFNLLINNFVFNNLN